MMNGRAPQISVVILANNEEQNLRRMLPVLARQKVSEPFEIVLIDSGSTDGTMQVARQFGAQIYQIAPDQFQHGRARNLGALRARGRFLVYLVADAVPADDHWLARMVEPLADPTIGGVFCRQMPPKGTIPTQAYALEHRYGPENRRHVLRPGEPLTLSRVRISNVSASYRRQTVLEMPFAEHLIVCEDVAMGLALLRGGLDVLYRGDTAVYHAHNYSLRQIFRRYFDIGSSLRDLWAELPSQARDEGSRPLENPVRQFLAYAAGQASYLARHRRWGWFFIVPFYDAARLAGYVAGRCHHRLPRMLRRKCSLPRHRMFWDQSPAAAPPVVAPMSPGPAMASAEVIAHPSSDAA
ncbi:MAG: glycosyltransferase [Phycisphaeraceae bacterium]|nr:glycosyltransferase [Phycisphaeraceae bacterium]